MASERNMFLLDPNDSEYSDLTLKFSGEERKVHKLVLGNQSGWFSTALSSNFKEGSASTIELFEDDPDLLNAMLDYLYDGKYDHLHHRRQLFEEKKGHTFDAQLYFLADKYDVVSLRKRIEKFFKSELMLGTDTMVYETIDYIYTMPSVASADLRIIFTNKTRTSLPKMLKDEAFRSLLLRHSELGMSFLDLCASEANSSVSETIWTCINCGCRFVVLATDSRHLGCPYCYEPGCSEESGRCIGFKC